MMDRDVKRGKPSDYQAKALRIVRGYINAQFDKSDPEVPEFGLFVVWFSKTLQNWKCLVSSTLLDQKYYEVTYDGNNERTYLDCYIKLVNVVFPDSDDVTTSQGLLDTTDVPRNFFAPEDV